MQNITRPRFGDTVISLIISVNLFLDRLTFEPALSHLSMLEANVIYLYAAFGTV